MWLVDAADMLHVSMCEAWMQQLHVGARGMLG
jgi:hypothetical protein